MQGHDLLTAHFCNNERTSVETYWVTPDGKETRVNYIEAKEGDPQWEDLLEKITIDAIHENTYKHIREQNTLFQDDVIKIAKERGLIYDIDSINTDIYKVIVAAIFASFDKEKDKEKLFMWKLQLFEVEEIKNSSNKELKSKLRKAKTILEATSYAIQIVENTSDTTE